MTVFIIDDEKNIRRSLELILKGAGFEVRTFASGKEALQDLNAHSPDVVLLDVMLGKENGLEVLSSLKEASPVSEVIMISGHANLSMAVEATRLGAYDFLEKPLQKERVLLVLKHLGDRRRLQHRYADLQASVSDQYRIIGESAPLKAILAQVERVANTDSKVLITGESGAGKELIAFAIHHASERAGQPFIKMNCAAIPEELIESELFGSEKGAFTGANQRREGKFSQADKGTLFLDEVGDMSLRVQTKILRVLQDGQFQRVGGSEMLNCDVRIVAATNRDLAEMVAEGRFREDLYFRLNVFPLEIPSLRDRREDIPLLVEHFIHRFCQRNNRRKVVVQEGVLGVLKDYHWPGNIRELQNVVERLVILSEKGEIGLAQLPGYLLKTPAVSEIPPAGSRSLAEVRAEAEKAYILRCIEATGGNISKAAQLLGMERTNLHKKMKALGIKKSEH